MIEFQRGAFRVFTGCMEFRRGAKEFLAARDSFVSRLPLSPAPPLLLGSFDSSRGRLSSPESAVRNLFGLLYRRFIIAGA